MRKILVIAAREYKAAVKTKSFLISLLLIPVLMMASGVIQYFYRKQADTEEKHFAVVDRTPGQEIYKALEDVAAHHNEHDIVDPKTKQQTGSKFVLEKVEPRSGSEQDIDEQRLELSQLVLQGKYFGFVEIGPDVRKVSSLATMLGVGKGGELKEDRVYVRYQTNRPTYDTFPRWVEREILMAILVPGSKESRQKQVEIQTDIQKKLSLKVKGLTKQDPTTGQITDPPIEHLVARYLVPLALVVLMFMVVMISSPPAMQGVVEEKMQRIAEVLLGSVRPFELMMGKLVGLMGVSLTIAGAYLAVAYYIAHCYDVTGFLPPTLLAWFLLNQLLAVVMFGSVFLAIGSAVTDHKESQTLVMPVIMLACIPMFVLSIALEDPNNRLVTWLSFFPMVTPMLMTVRIAVPPGVPWWQPLVAIALVLLTATVCVYAAGRIFRVGILMQGKGAKLSDLLRWIVRG